MSARDNQIELVCLEPDTFTYRVPRDDGTFDEHEITLELGEKRKGVLSEWLSDASSNVTIRKKIGTKVVSFPNPKINWREKHTTEARIARIKYGISHPKSSPKRMKISILENGKGLPLPKYAKPDDAGLDLIAAHDTKLYANIPVTVRTGIAIAIPRGHCGLIRSRSGLQRQGVEAFHGTIDAGYRGEIQVRLTWNPDREENAAARDTASEHYCFKIDRGMKIAQILIMPVRQVQLDIVDVLPDSARGACGFGSTGLTA